MVTGVHQVGSTAAVASSRTLEGPGNASGGSPARLSRGAPGQTLNSGAVVKLQTVPQIDPNRVAQAEQKGKARSHHGRPSTSTLTSVASFATRAAAQDSKQEEQPNLSEAVPSRAPSYHANTSSHVDLTIRVCTSGEIQSDGAVVCSDLLDDPRLDSENWIEEYTIGE